MRESKIQRLALNQVHIKDSFWNKHIQLVKDTILPYQWDIINDRVPGVETSHSLMNIRIAAKLSEGEFYGQVFQDTDVAKWLEAVAYTIAVSKDEKLENDADMVIDMIERAQEKDGYFNTYYILKKEKRFSNLTEGHELYTAGHLIEAGVAYYEATRKDKLLNVCRKLADLICNTFGEEEGKIHGYPGHQEIELALVKLYDVTKQKKYLDMAKYFIDKRGVGKNYFLEEQKKENYHHIFDEFKNYDPIYSQSHLPVREQKTAEGHAVRATYMYCAMADLAYAYEDEELLQTSITIWNNIVNQRMFITGGIGSSGYLERFTTDYDLPNDSNYAETCASIGLSYFSFRMNQITKEAKYIDILEKELYNTILSGVSLDGKSFFYVNPLEVWPASLIPLTSKAHVKANRQQWFGVACCPPNIARTLASIGQYIYGIDQDTIYINLFIENETIVQIGEKNYKISIITKFPFDSTISISVQKLTEYTCDTDIQPNEIKDIRNVLSKNAEINDTVKLKIRIPEYTKNFVIKKGEENIKYDNHLGYATIELSHEELLCNQEIVIHMDMKARFVHANPLVRKDSGKVCIMKGPLVYALEEIDNGKNLSAIMISTKQELVEKYEEDLLGGVTVIHLSGKKISEMNWTDHKLYDSREVLFDEVKLKAIPYAYWNNRGEGEMLVWIKEIFES
ncbi:glycoside hydrolase family 127 protein [Anaeromicropila herbilytica]|uniref:Glycoside hydrolase family 127 protein n=1 Tax=Anaeromicropila herbilytica TaxID=2785025 RepID=A0A7R7IBW5_9FIRM|nr:beta-L-arabinofuranosidase domain-containing protein [Anaeromicropila herbilytica]BCN30063.1 hypothetical protein bsdtb5_13580 [Anaeromicropila herbilytica]